MVVILADRLRPASQMKGLFFHEEFNLEDGTWPELSEPPHVFGERARSQGRSAAISNRHPSLVVLRDSLLCWRPHSIAQDRHRRSQRCGEALPAHSALPRPAG